MRQLKDVGHPAKIISNKYLSLAFLSQVDQNTVDSRLSVPFPNVSPCKVKETYLNGLRGSGTNMADSGESALSLRAEEGRDSTFRHVRSHRFFRSRSSFFAGFPHTVIF